MSSIAQRLRDLAQDLEETLEAQAVEVEQDLEDDDDREAEMLDLAAERDQLSAELEIARERVRELEARVQSMAEELRKPAHCFGDRSRPALNTPESREDHGAAEEPRDLFGGAR